VAGDLSKAWQILHNDGCLALASAVMRSSQNRLSVTDRRRALAEIGSIAASDVASAEKITRIYDKRLWLRVNPAINADASLSGQGSTLDARAGMLFVSR
jgi:hypothetical protein